MKKIVIRFIVCLIATFYLVTDMRAVPAYPNKIWVVAENGKAVAIYMRGDEHLKYAVTEDGYTLLSDSVGWWYADYADEVGVVKSDFMLMATEDETAELKQFKAMCPRMLIPEKDNQNQVNRVVGVNHAKPSNPVVGERRALVILMQYKDLAFKTTDEDFESLFNELDYHKGNATGSVRDYYRFASQGQLDYVSDIYGPYTAKNNMSYYGGNSVAGGNDSHAVELCIEAMKCLPDTIDFSKYDNDDDGLIDNVHIIYAGYGEEAGGPSSAIWAHEYPHRIILTSEIGYSLAGYSCSPELRGNQGSNISHIGVVCHELGHALGAMDYYDTNYGTGGEYDGTGKWDIMASGSWNDNGRTPPNFNPYVRTAIFGWNKQETLTAEQQIVMPRMEVDNAEQTVVYRMETGSEGDYFLLENRQQYSFDAALPGSGLMVYHVHPNIERYRSTNTINATHPQAMYPVCAAYSEPSKKKYGNINSNECPFPGSSNVKLFTPSSMPAAVAWNGSASKVSLHDITLYTSNGTIAFTTGEDLVVGPDDPGNTEEGIVIYKESFEQGWADRITVTSVLGNSLWQSYKKGDFVSGANNIPNPTDGERVLMLYAAKTNITSESEATSPFIEIEAGCGYTLSLDLQLSSDVSTRVPQFTLYMEDEYGEYNLFSLNKQTTGWQHVELPLVFAGNKVRYTLHGHIVTGGIFVDNVMLVQDDTPSSINLSTASPYNQSSIVYNINGIFIGNFKDVIGSLKSGMYIIRTGSVSKKIIIR